ncbi:hypothetical protein LDC_0281 [sediment metagenome]|uniref:Uncharacterized protein n=1 Tax=sediment metagenome TaxID=749907 RepID=D9PFJ9_9ZZZZ
MSKEVLVSSAKELFTIKNDKAKSKIKSIFFINFILNFYKFAKSSKKVYEAKSISVASTVFITIDFAFFIYSSFQADAMK